MTFKRGTRSKRDNRNPVLCCHTNDVGNLVGVLRKNHGVRWLVRNPRGRVSMLFPDGLTGLKPVAKALLQNSDGGFYTGLIAGQSCLMWHG